MSVYLIDDGNGRVEIGCADDPTIRLAHLQCSSPDELSIIRILSGGALAKKFLHEKFASKRIRGAWFEFDKRMLTFDIPKDLHFPSEHLSRVNWDMLSQKLGVGTSTLREWHDAGVPADQHILVEKALDEIEKGSAFATEHRLIALFGATVIAERLGVAMHPVHHWLRRRRIPAEYSVAIRNAAADCLIEMVSEAFVHLPMEEREAVVARVTQAAKQPDGSGRKPLAARRRRTYYRKPA